MRTVSELIEDARRGAGSVWSHGDALTEWARPFGTDLLRAWATCHRGDYLAVLAPQVGCRRDVLRQVAHDVTLDLLDLIPEYRTEFRRLVSFSAVNTESHAIPHRVLVLASSILSDLRRSDSESQVDVRHALEDSTLFLSDLMVEQGRIAVPRGGIGSTERPRLGLLVEMASAPAMERLKILQLARYRRFAAIFAFRAAMSTMSLTAFNNGAKPTNVPPHRGVNADGVQAPRLTDTDYKVAALAANTMLQASLARGWAGAATEGSWQAGLQSLAAFCLKSASQGERAGALDMTSAWTSFENAIVRPTETTAGQRLQEYARTLRKRAEGGPPLMYTTLPDPSAATAALGADIPGSRRQSIRNDLEGLAALAKRLGAAQLAEAIDVALVLLRSAGPLDPARLAPVIVEVHGRFIDIIRERSKGLSANQVAEWQTTADTLEQHFEETTEALEVELAPTRRAPN